MASFSAGDIEATLRAKRDQFNADLDAAKADAARATKDPVNFTLRADPAAALDGIAKVQAAKDKAATDASFKLSADGGAAKTELDAVQAKKDKAGTDISFTVKAKDDASADLDKIALKADALGRKTETVNVRTKSDTSGLDDIGKKITALKDGPFNLLTSAIVGLGPAAVPVLGVVTAAVAPLGAAIGSAVAGLGAFGLVSKAVLTQAGTAAAAVSKAQAAYNAAIGAGTKQSTAYATEQKAIAVAYAGMSTQQITLSKQVGDLDSAYKGMLKSVTPLVSSALVPWMKDVQGLLGYIKPLIAPVAALFGQWGTELGQALSSNSAKISAFIASFAAASAGNIQNFGDALVWFAKAAGSLIHDIAPNLDGASLSIARLAASFAGWAQSKQAAADIQGFFAWVKSEAPGVEKFITTLAAALGNLVKAAAATGGGDLTVLTTALGAIAALPPAAIGALADGYVTLSLGLRAATVAIGAWNAASVIAKGIQAALSDEVEVTGAALAVSKVATLAMAAADAVVDAAETIYIALMLAADAASLPLIAVVGGIVVAVGLLGAGIYELATHWTTVWHGILDVTQAVWNWVKGNWPLLTAILLGPVAVAVLEIVEHWNTIKDAFSAVIDWITAHWKTILVVLTGPVGAAALWIASNWNGITRVFSDVLDWLSAHWKLILVILTGPVGLAALWLVHAWAGIHNDIDAAWNAIAAFFTSWWNAEVAKFKAMGAAVASALSAAWNAITGAARAAWAAIAAFFVSWWNAEVAYFRGPVTAIENALKAAWAAITAAARAAWGAIASFFTSWWNSEVAAFRGPVAAIASALTAAWNGIESATRAVFGRISAFFTSFWGSLRSGFAAAVSGVQAAWSGLENVVKIPVDWVIKNVYDALIVRFWNDVAGPVGLPKLAALAEGGIVPGGYSRDDNQLVWMRSGEGVLQPGAVAALGGRGFIDWANATYGDVPVSASVPGRSYAGGGFHIPNPVSAIIGGAKTVIHAVTDVGGFLGGLVNDVKNGIYSGLAAAGSAIIGGAAKLIPGSSGVADAMRAYPLKLWDGFAAWVTGHGPGPAAQGSKYTGKFGTGVAQWTADVLKVLAMLGLPASDAALVLYQMQTECVTVDTVILTKRGWLDYTEVKPGDETIGYNPETGRSEWTRIERVVHYPQRETWRFGNKYWSVKCTPNHRWLTEHVVRRPAGQQPLTACPECGVTGGQRGPFPSQRAMQIHRAREHAVVGDRHGAPTVELVTGTGMLPLQDIGLQDRVVLASEADTGTSLNITLNEAALLGWIAGDGWVSEPSDHWHDRKPEAARKPPDEDAPFGYRRDGQPRKNAGGRPLATGPVHTVQPLSLGVCQAKPEHFAAIDAAFSVDPDHVRYPERPGRKPHHKPVVEWRLSTAYSRDLLKRAGNPKTDAVSQVLRMSAVQRESWLNAMIAAEGHSTPGKTVIYQNDGPVADAIELAVYLSGHRPARTKAHSGWGIGITAARVGGPSRNSFREPAGYQDVWCVTTGLGTWTARQEGHVFLTGNSGGNPNAINLTDINAQQGDPSRGLLQTIGTTFAAYRSPSLPNNIYDPMANIYAAVNYAVHGPGIGTRPGQLGGGSGYDEGGWLMPGMTMTMNATGRPEPVLTGSQWDSLTSAVAGNDLGSKLDRIAALLAAGPYATASGLGDVLNGASRGASFRARYPRNS